MVNQTFPKIFSRATPLLDGRTSILESARILTALQVSAVMLKSSAKDRVEYKALTGYSILSKFLTKRRTFSKFLAGRSFDIAREVMIVKETDSIVSVIKAIHESNLGLVIVSRKSDSSNVLTTLELRDFVRLYRNGMELPWTKLKIGDLASSPILSVKSESTLRDLLETMLQFRVRKVFLPETRSIVSDRDILSYITSPRIVRLVDKTPELVLKTRVSELSSSRPPMVDSRMKITEAVQLINPDTGDSLLCDRGLVTFWDLIIKLESSNRAKLAVEKLINDGSLHTLPINENEAGESLRLLKKRRAEREMTPSQRKQFSTIAKKIQEQGFIDAQSVPYFTRVRIVDPLYLKRPARPFHIAGVNSSEKGGRKFTSVDFFGPKVIREFYYVLDWERFSKFISAKLELKFRATNIDPPRMLKKAFTQFMHDFGFHWTGCSHAESKN